MSDVATVVQKQHGKRTVTRTRPSLGVLLERFAVPLLLVILVIWFSASSEIGAVFRSPGNVQNILANAAVVGLVATAMVIPMVAGNFDLSVPAIAGLTNVVMASLLATHQQSILVGLVVGILVGLITGLINGVLIGVVRLNPFITTLGMYILISGLLQFYTNGQTISSGMPAVLGQWGSGKWLGVARPFWILLIVAVVVWYLLVQTPFGRKLAAIGSNEDAARLAGVRVNRAVVVSYALSGLIGGIAGAVLTIRNGGGDSTSAISYLFPAFAALFLGQTAFTPGRPNVWGTICGVFLIAVAVNGLSFMGASAWVSSVFNGAALILSVAVSTLTVRARERRSKAVQLEAIRRQ